MNIVPLGGSDTLAGVPRGGVQGVAGPITRSAGGPIGPGDSTKLCRVLSPWQLGVCKPWATVTARGNVPGGRAQVTDLAMKSHAVGLLTYNATRRQRSATGSLLNATGVDAIKLKFPHLQNMATVASAHEPASGNMNRLYTAIAAGLPEGAAPFFIYSQINAHRISLG